MVYPVYPSAYHYNTVQHRTPRHGQSNPNQSPPNPDEFARQLGGDQARPQADTPNAGAGKSSINAEQPAVHSTQKSLQGQTIGIDDIVNDVMGTMDALGADDTTRNDVGVYLAAVQHQAQQTNPNKRFMQEGLKVIGTRLDTFIGEALKQPSTVVNEWVQALLLQPIEYRSSGKAVVAATVSGVVGGAAPVQNVANPTAQTATPPGVPQASASAATVVAPSHNAALTAALKQAKTLTKQGDTIQATAVLQQALADDTLTPAHTGRVHFALGKVADTTGDWDAAKQAYSNALQHPLPTRRKVQAHGALANALEQLGETDEALSHYQQALSAIPNKLTKKSSRALAGTVSRLENDYGSLLYIQQGAQAAQPHFANARQWAIKGNHQLLPDIYGNLAQVWQALEDPTQRNQAYLKGLNAAKKLGDQSSYLNLLAEYQQHVAA